MDRINKRDEWVMKLALVVTTCFVEIATVTEIGI